jgi:uncharacterized protein (TIGR00369 family)
MRTREPETPTRPRRPATGSVPTMSNPPAPDPARSDPAVVHAHRFPPLPPERLARWERFLKWDTTLFPMFVGLTVEEMRTDYARLRLPYRAELDQPAGVIHGGALATLIDTVVVPAIGTAYEERWVMLTLSMTIDYIGSIAKQDAIAEGWVTRRGSSIVFCGAEVRGQDGALAAAASLVYKVSSSRRVTVE